MRVAIPSIPFPPHKWNRTDILGVECDGEPMRQRKEVLICVIVGVAWLYVHSSGCYAQPLQLLQVNQSSS